MKKKSRMKSVHLIPLSFLVVIVIGTYLLTLPISTASGEGTDYITALFTATTSVCVTGLVVVDTFSYWSIFGQVVIVLLIQIGGLGVVTVGGLLMMARKMKFSLGDRALLEDSLNVDRKREVKTFLGRIIRGVILVEAVGAGLYAIEFVPLLGVFKGIWASIFHSVSAFCNAGMDVVGPNSMIDFNHSPLLMIVTMVLIVLGGIGFVVWIDVVDSVKTGLKMNYSLKLMIRRMSEHTKLVILLTLALIVVGAAIVFVAEYNNPATIGGMEFGYKILNSFFQSVTWRTAGFASVPQAELTDVTIVVGCIFMFIGGSPIGTAGGVKTVTAFLFFANAVSYVIGRQETVIFNRRVTAERMRKAAAIVFVSMGIALIMTLLLLSRGGMDLTAALYEVFSAIGTVGVSKGLTPNLDGIGRLIIILSMYLGRIGPISMAFVFSGENNISNKIRHSEGNFYVG